MLGLDPSNLPNAGSVQAKVEEFEKEAKRKFVEEPANMKLLIVVDKLLTGSPGETGTVRDPCNGGTFQL